MKFDLAAELAKLLEAQPEFLDDRERSSDDAGVAIIPDGGTEVRVEFNTPFARPPAVSATPYDLPENLTWTVTDRSAVGFSIRLSKPVTSDLTFTWTAFSLKDDRTTHGQASKSEPETEVGESTESEHDETSDAPTSGNDENKEVTTDHRNEPTTVAPKESSPAADTKAEDSESVPASAL